MKRKTTFTILLFILSVPLGVFAQSSYERAVSWADSVYQSMTLEEQLGQLFIIRAHSNLGASHEAAVEQLIRKYKVGGLCFFQGTPERQVQLINRYQQISEEVPLLITMDAEWGLGMRMAESTISFPKQLMLGAIQNNRLIYEMGKEIARQLRRTGVHVNFAPVADINNNPNNPVINDRSFGEDRYNVTVKSYMYMKGMQERGVMASAKHFPGHGDTNVDSHYDLPVINYQRGRLDSLELFPFRHLAAYGIGSMMVAHLNVPALDDRANRTTTLSENTITDLLKGELNFKGLIFTDALEMKAVSKNFENGEVEAEAFLAGNDMLSLPNDMGAAISSIKKYIEEGKIPLSRVEESVKKILISKYQLGLKKFRPISEKSVREDVNSLEAKALKRKLCQEALTLVRNPQGFLPISDRLTDAASVSIGTTRKTVFQQRLDSFGEFAHFQLGKSIPAATRTSMIRRLESKDIVFVSLHNMSKYASRDFGITADVRSFISELNKQTKVVLVVFGSPYSLKFFDEVNWVLEAYQEDELIQDLSAQALFGVFSIRGRLPVTASVQSSYNMGVVTKPLMRFGYARPEDVGMHPDSLKKIDELAEEAIRKRATPGCVVLVAKDGQIVYEKAFGYHTYRERKRVQEEDMYDLASITKIAASTVSIMQLHERNKLDVDLPLSTFLPELENSNKLDMIIKDIMAHHAGLISWIPFYQKTVAGGRRNRRPMPQYYQGAESASFNVPVAPRLYMRNDYVDSVWQEIIHSDLRSRTDYRYSDLGFYLFAKLVERVSGLPIDEYAKQEIYDPLQLTSTTFNPWKDIPLNRIPPSESDRYFRRQEVRGYVHDMGAAMLGGVSGHAGLFSNAEELATIMQMLLQGGYYNNRRLLQPETIRAFTERHPRSSRRGIGFDMQELDPTRSMNMSPLASSNTFGHLGFTGTCTWADPDNNMVYVFLSNRTYPTMYNYKLSKYDYRPRIQSILYESLMDPEKDNRSSGSREETQ
jgi:beta-N-acetylhexosaminidase